MAVAGVAEYSGTVVRNRNRSMGVFPRPTRNCNTKGVAALAVDFDGADVVARATVKSLWVANRADLLYPRPLH